MDGVTPIRGRRGGQGGERPPLRVEKTHSLSWWTSLCSTFPPSGCRRRPKNSIFTCKAQNFCYFLKFEENCVLVPTSIPPDELAPPCRAITLNYLTDVTSNISHHLVTRQTQFYQKISTCKNVVTFCNSRNIYLLIPLWSGLTWL